MSIPGTDHSHHEEHFKQSLALRDLVIGMADGLTVPFALAAGLSAVGSTRMVVVAGVAEVIAGSISMGLGGYLAGKTEVDHYHGELKREYREVSTIPEVEKQEVRAIFTHYGISDSAIEGLVEDLAQDKDKWVQFMMKFELGMEEPDASQATRSALRIGLAYACGGMVPLLPYFWNEAAQSALIQSSLMTGFALLAFGAMKARFTGQAPVQGAIKVAVIGALAAFAAYGIALFINSKIG